ncbi:MAG: DUF6370 family protein [Pirellulaceae bacterium]|nr:DUF6370 family protein [Pirellulaceae bacterium]
MRIQLLTVSLLSLGTCCGCTPTADNLPSGQVAPRMTEDQVTDATTPPIRLEDEIVEASCGECQFGMPGNGCNLAIRWEGHVFFVDGTGIDDHGDAHAESGFCNCIRPARVSGLLVQGRFNADKFALIEEKQ